mgnify:CR=1 FL=1
MGILTLINTMTAAGDDYLIDTSSMTSAYDEYMFVMTDMNPATDQTNLLFQVNADGAADYNETITSTFARSYNQENDGGVDGPDYVTAADQSQGTAFQYLSEGSQAGNAADESLAGVLHIFSPASTTYMKHFYATVNEHRYSGAISYAWITGYINTTAAITDIQFKMASGAMDGVIQVYGIS